MPVKLRNISGVAREVDGKTVEPDEVVEVKGGLRKNSPDDGHLIGTGDDARVYAAAHWDLADHTDPEEDPTDAPSDPAEKEND